jgi:hypothetical protein
MVLAGGVTSATATIRGGRWEAPAQYERAQRNFEKNKNSRQKDSLFFLFTLVTGKSLQFFLGFLLSLAGRHGWFVMYEGLRVGERGPAGTSRGMAPPAQWV